MTPIKQAFTASKLSQGAFGRALSIPRSKLQRLLSGEQECHPNLLARAEKLARVHVGLVRNLVQRFPEITEIPHYIFQAEEDMRLNGDNQFWADIDYLHALQTAEPELLKISSEVWRFVLDEGKK